jgi:hypothetical protein
VVYLVIMFVVAAAGITRLWLQQRKERSHLDTVDGFRESLESISTKPERRRVSRPVRVERRSSSGQRTLAYADGPVRHAAPSIRSTVPKYKPLDPERRAAAKRRLEQRRKARSRASF